MIAAEAARALEIPEAESYLAHGRGARSWLLTFDHKRIGVMYLVAIGAALLLGGVFALVLRLNLWRPEGGIVSNDAYNKLFTLHG
ncbi:MAG TPA: cytochrome c oxidase subunit I, partial [Anaeromyxobacter sp.]